MAEELNEKSPEKWKRFLEEHELPLRAIPVAIVSHEIIGIGWLGGTWLGCYLLQPSRFIAGMVSPQTIGRTIDEARRFVSVSDSLNTIFLKYCGKASRFLESMDRKDPSSPQNGQGSVVDVLRRIFAYSKRREASYDSVQVMGCVRDSSFLRIKNPAFALIINLSH